MPPNTPDDRKSRRCPRRPYGSSCGVGGASNANLPTTVPIIGMGGSSFSNFYNKPRGSDHADGAAEDPVHVDLESISPDIPIVQSWIGAIRRAVVDRGVTLIDTAPWYGHGVSEVVIGYAMDVILPLDPKDRAGDGGNDAGATITRSDLTINTKVGRYEADRANMFDFSYERTLTSARRSVDRMRCGYIDVVQLHDPEFSPSIDVLVAETIPALIRCRKLGLARAIGLTGYPLEVQREILVRSREDPVAGAGGGDGFVFDQCLTYCHCNLHDTSLLYGSRSDEVKRDSQPPFADFCFSHGIALMAAAPLSMGLLTDAGPPPWHPAHSSLKEASREAARLCSSMGVELATISIIYALSFGRVPCTLLGMKSADEVDRAVDLALRFEGINGSNDILPEVLTEKEQQVLGILLDTNDGPFAKVWKSGEYLWDGKEEANKFWSKLELSRDAIEKQV